MVVITVHTGADQMNARLYYGNIHIKDLRLPFAVFCAQPSFRRFPRAMMRRDKQLCVADFCRVVDQVEQHALHRRIAGKNIFRVKGVCETQDHGQGVQIAAGVSDIIAVQFERFPFGRKAKVSADLKVAISCAEVKAALDAAEKEAPNIGMAGIHALA